MVLKTIDFPKGKKVYFASDNNPGGPPFKESLPREKKLVAWLDSIKVDADSIFLMNSFRLFGMKRKLGFLCPFFGFFELRSWATEGKKEGKWVQKNNFLAI